MMYALVIMFCSRSCAPNFVEIYDSKTACMAVVDKNTSMFHNPTSYCVPVLTASKLKEPT